MDEKLVDKTLVDDKSPARPLMVDVGAGATELRKSFSAEDRLSRKSRKKRTQSAVADPDPIEVIPIKPEHLRPVIEMPFAIAAVRTGCPEVGLDEVEAKCLSEQSAAVVNQFLPAGGGKWVALALFACSLCGVAATKAALVKAMEARRKEGSSYVRGD